MVIRVGPCDKYWYWHYHCLFFFLFKVSRKLVKSIILIISKLILFIEQIIKKKKKIFDTQGLYPGRLAAISLLLYHNATRTLCSGLWSTESCKCLDRFKSKLYIVHAYKRLYQKIIKSKIKAKIVEKFKLFVFQWWPKVTAEVNLCKGHCHKNWLWINYNFRKK